MNSLSKEMRLILFIVLVVGGLFIIRKKMTKTFTPVEVAPIQVAPTAAPEAEVSGTKYRVAKSPESKPENNGQEFVKPKPSPEEQTLGEGTPPSAEALSIKANIAQYALQRFMKDTGFSFSAPFSFYEFNIINIDEKTLVFETLENSKNQELIVVVRDGGDPVSMITELAGKKGYELKASQVAVNTIKKIDVDENFGVVYYSTNSKRNALAIIWVQKSEITAQDMASFKSALNK